MWPFNSKTNKEVGLKAAETTNQVITRLIEKAVVRTRKDISDWRMSLKIAENIERPRRLSYMNLCDELVLDNHLFSIMQTRKYRVVGQAFKVVDDKGQPLEEQTAILNQPWFSHFMELAMDSLFYGTTLIEFGTPTDTGFTSVEVVPRRHVVPEYGGFLRETSDTNTIPYRDTPLMNYLIEVGGRKDLGLLSKAAPNMLWKKNAMMAWSEYTEMFGMPIRVGKTNSRMTGDVDRMATALKDMGSAAYAVIDEAEEISFIESTKGDAYMVYDKLIERCNGEMSKLILGQTGTTDLGQQSGSRAQAQVHERQGDEITKADLRFMRNLVNTEVFRILNTHGFKFDKCRFEFDVADDITVDQWTIDQGLLQEFEIEDQYFIEKYRVPITGNKLNTTKPPAKGNNQGLNLVQLHADLYELYKTKEEDCCQ